eukprot:3423403-Amphidinium_carterae.1
MCHRGRADEIREDDKVVRFLLVHFGGMNELAPMTAECAESLQEYVDWNESQPVGTPPFIPGSNELVFEMERKPHSMEEVAALVCRELHQLHSLPLLRHLAHISVSFALFHLTVSRQVLHQAFGYENNLIVGISMYLAISKSLTKFLGFLFCPLLRHCEFWADASAVEGGYGDALGAALSRDDGQGKSENPNADWFYAMFVSPHPDILERLHNIRRKQSMMAKKAR